MKRFRIKDLEGMGISIAEFIRRSEISFQTLKKIDANDPTVRPANVGRALQTLEKIRAEISPRASGRQHEGTSRAG